MVLWYVPKEKFFLSKSTHIETNKAQMKWADKQEDNKDISGIATILACDS